MSARVASGFCRYEGRAWWSSAAYKSLPALPRARTQALSAYVSEGDCSGGRAAAAIFAEHQGLWTEAIFSRQAQQTRGAARRAHKWHSNIHVHEQQNYALSQCSRNCKILARQRVRDARGRKLLITGRAQAALEPRAPTTALSAPPGSPRSVYRYSAVATVRTPKNGERPA